MIIGLSMGLETCPILGQVSHNLLYWKKRIYVVRGRLTRKQLTSRPDQKMARAPEVSGKTRQVEGEAKVV